MANELVKWDYDKSVAWMRPKVKSLKSKWEEMEPEFRHARDELSREGNPHNELTGNKVPVKSWNDYCVDVGWTRQYVNRLLLGSDNVHFSSATNEWTTPDDIIKRVRGLFGVIDLDPCSDPDATVPAKETFKLEDNGLEREWHGRVYMNPPYGRELPDWVIKLEEEYVSGRVKEAIALIPARPDTEWFHAFREYPRCFIFGRLKFGGQENSAPFPSMLVYLGKNRNGFIEATKDIGDVYEVVNE
jgi:hypothetical protein